MRVAAVSGLIRYVNPLRLFGAIFDKELRVAARRRRNYVLRFLYISLFTAFVVLVWLAAVPAFSTGVVQASRMGFAGITMIVVIVWFQFIASQVVAVITLSTAISDEIYHKTLGLLMTTPISSLQIVLGKLASRLLQIVLLLGMSLPSLAIVRVFGGVPWDFLLCTFSVTGATAVFYGSMSLFCSIFSRRAYVVIIETILAGAVLFAFLPLAVSLGLHDRLPQPLLAAAVSLTNPYIIIAAASDRLMGMGGPLGSRVLWVEHCALSLGGSTLLLILSAVFVRRVALRQVAGQDGSLFAGRASGGVRKVPSTRMRRVQGTPVFWRERRVPILGKTPIRKVIAVAGTTGLLLVMYVLCGREGILGDRDTQGAFVFVLACLGLLATLILPATCITSEKEARSWPLLLASPLRNREILSGKLLGAIRRCSIVWLLLFVHVTVFILARCIHPIALPQLGIVVVSSLVFFCSTGLYFGVRFKHTTTAVIANLALAGGLWLGVPILLELVRRRCAGCELRARV